MNFYQVLCWLLLRPYSTENSRAERLEIGEVRGIHGPEQPQLSYRAASSAKQERDAPFIQIGPSHETDSKFIRNYILLEIIWDIPRPSMGQENTPTLFTED